MIAIQAANEKNVSMFNKINIGRLVFVSGGIIDLGVALSWFAIASGFHLPNILNGYVGEGGDYRFAMFIAAMFMTGWSVLLFWGAQLPYERRGLLMISAVLLVLSIVMETLFYAELLAGFGFYLGVTKRLLISLIMLLTYYGLKRVGSK